MGVRRVGLMEGEEGVEGEQGVGSSGKGTTGAAVAAGQQQPQHGSGILCQHQHSRGHEAH